MSGGAGGGWGFALAAPLPSSFKVSGANGERLGAAPGAAGMLGKATGAGATGTAGVADCGGGGGAGFIGGGAVAVRPAGGTRDARLGLAG